MQRFNVRVSGKISRGPWNVAFKGRSKYYHCARCAARTFINRRHLDIFNPRTSPFSPELQGAFGEVPAFRAGHDFYCRGCGQPVRLLYWSQERGMGGPWDPFVIVVLELERDATGGD
jgi:hypothetical protein